MKLVVIAGTHSGVGKTTIAAGIIAALRRRGLRVEAFKAGPDYIDPSYLGRASGRGCRNLDTWLLSPEAIRELVARRASRCDVGVIEGVMGLFDGRSAMDESGSTGHLAKILGAPVLLVIDGSAMARSAAAVALGYQRLDPDLRLVGVILNRIAGDVHYQMAAEPIREATALPVLGYLREDPALRLAERHLGLVPVAEGGPPDEFFERLAVSVEQAIDLDVLLELAAPFHADVTPRLFPPTGRPPCARIAVAMDPAFSFYYEDGLDLLRAWGAEIAPFSPLSDAALPDDVDAVYIGGGFPELFAADLSANTGMHASLRTAARSGLPVYGECGGLMYLGRTLRDLAGQTHAMAGLISLESCMEGGLTLGYREASALRSSPFLAAGDRVRGHEFHWSSLVTPPPAERLAYRFSEPPLREGYAESNIFASYLHVHFGSDARLAPKFVRSVQEASGRAAGRRGVM